jgi:hypothetical protein
MRPVRRPSPSERGRPLRTARDRCLWHASGTAGEDDDARIFVRGCLPERSDLVLVDGGQHAGRSRCLDCGSRTGRLACCLWGRERPSAWSGVHARDGEAGQVDRGGQQPPVLPDPQQASDAGSSTAVPAAEQMGELALHRRPVGAISARQAGSRYRALAACSRVSCGWMVMVRPAALLVHRSCGPGRPVGPGPWRHPRRWPRRPRRHR